MYKLVYLPENLRVYIEFAKLEDNRTIKLTAKPWENKIDLIEAFNSFKFYIKNQKFYQKDLDVRFTEPIIWGSSRNLTKNQVELPKYLFEIIEI